MKLRDVGPDDLALWERLRCDPAMNTELGGPQPREEIPGKLAEDVAAVNTDTSWIVVAESDDGEAMGSVCIWRHDDDAPFSEIGWGVLPEFQGRGVGKRSVAALLERAGADGRWGTIHAFPAITNAPSNGICRSLGFTLIGQEAFEFRGTTLHCNHWQIDPAEDLDPLP
ncbi:MAG TPA: GNAT family N-acetyltransferase [Actinomycetota bacterium]